MPLTERAFLNLRSLGVGEEVDLLLLKWPAGSAGQWFLAIPARVCHAGAILALPAAALQPEELDAGKEAAAEALVGPSLAVSMAIEGGADPDELLEVVLVEFGPGIRHQLEKKTPRGRRTFVGFHGDPRVLPCLAELEECVASWIDSGVVRSDAFYTAPESGEDAAEDPVLPQDDILAQLQLLQTAVEQRLGKLETQVQGLSNPRPGALRKGVVADGRSRQPSERGESSEPRARSEILANIRSQVPPPPRLPDEPGKGVETAKGSTRATPGAAEECEKGASVAEMIQLSMLQLMKDMQRPKAAKKTKRLPGLPIDLSEESDAEEEEKWSSSSRGGRGIEAVERLRHAMKSHPEQYTERMEQKMARAVEAGDLDASVPGKFELTVPVGKARTAGYALHGFVEIYKLFLENKPKQARLHTLRMIGAFEQFLIDENWTVASRLTMTSEPPWGAWATQDLPSLRRQYVYSRLTEPSMVGALINELKEEEWLAKKRGHVKKGDGKGKSEAAE